MNDGNYAINKYYTLEEINVAVGEKPIQALVERFLVVRVTKRVAGYSFVYQEVLGDGFNSYGDALSYIDDILGLPEAEDFPIGGQGYEET